MPLIGSAELAIVGRLDFDGVPRVQLAAVGPIPLVSGEDRAVISRLEVLIGDDGTPVRAVVEIDPANQDFDRSAVEFVFTDFGTEISIQPPVIP